MACTPYNIIDSYCSVIVQVAVRIKLQVTSCRTVYASYLDNIVYVNVKVSVNITWNSNDNNSADESVVCCVCFIWNWGGVSP